MPGPAFPLPAENRYCVVSDRRYCDFLLLPDRAFAYRADIEWRWVEPGEVRRVIFVMEDAVSLPTFNDLSSRGLQPCADPSCPLPEKEGRDSKSEPSTAAAVPFPKLFPHGRHCCPATVNAARAYDGQTTSGGSEPFGAFGFAGLCLIFSVLAALGVDPPSLGCARLAYLGIFAVPSWSHYSYSRHAASGCPCAGLSLG